MGEQALTTGSAAVYYYDSSINDWKSVDGGVSSVGLYHDPTAAFYRVVAIATTGEPVINSVLFPELTLSKLSDTFYSWQDPTTVYGVNFTSADEASAFASGMNDAVAALSAPPSSGGGGAPPPPAAPRPSEPKPAKPREAAAPKPAPVASGGDLMSDLAGAIGRGASGLKSRPKPQAAAPPKEEAAAPAFPKLKKAESKVAPRAAEPTPPVAARDEAPKPTPPRETSSPAPGSPMKPGGAKKAAPGGLPTPMASPGPKGGPRPDATPPPATRDMPPPMASRPDDKPPPISRTDSPGPTPKPGAKPITKGPIAKGSPATRPVSTELAPPAIARDSPRTEVAEAAFDSFAAANAGSGEYNWPGMKEELLSLLRSELDQAKQEILRAASSRRSSVGSGGGFSAPAAQPRAPAPFKRPETPPQEEEDWS